MTTPIYPAGSPVAITVTLPLWGGSPITPTAVTRVITDEAGVVISDTTAVTLPAAGATTVLVPVDAAFVTVAAGQPNALRQVTTTMTTAAGSWTDTQSFIVRSSTPLVRMTNSFITMPETMLVRSQMPTLDGWDAAGEDDRIAALISAHNAMLQLRYRFPIGENFQSRIVDFYGMSVDNVFGRIFVVLADIGFYNETDYAGWPANFQNALKRAQMTHADNLLAGDPIGDKRAAGITSETIGESSTKFRTVPEIQFPICRAAMTELRGYLNNAVLVARG